MYLQYYQSILFQSTLPRKERPITLGLNLLSIDFNPRSHARSDLLPDYLGVEKSISIHAPTQGATAKLHSFHTRKLCFTSKFYTIRLKITILSDQIIFFSRHFIKFPPFIWCESPREFMFTLHSHLAISGIYHKVIPT